MSGAERLSEAEVTRLEKLVGLRDIGTMRMLKLVEIFGKLLAERRALREALESIARERNGSNESAIRKADAALGKLRAGAADGKKEERK